jgi:hypothetical protein
VITPAAVPSTVATAHPSITRLSIPLPPAGQAGPGYVSRAGRSGSAPAAPG